MSLKESDVADRMRQSLREAIQACKELAVRSKKGSPYSNLRDALVVIEGCCRQMAVFREDATWLPFGVMMAECHRRAGGWLRGYTKNGVHIVWTPGHLNEMFVMLAGNLQGIAEVLDQKVTAKTNRVGIILPASPGPTRRTGAPSSMSGLILPASIRKAG